MYVRLDDWVIGARIFVKRSYEKHVADVVRQSLKAGDVMLDLGANIGYFTLLGASRVGAHGKVIAFEPDAGNRALIQKSLEQNSFSGVVICPYAVADRAGWAGFQREDSNGQLVPDGSSAGMYQVQTVALDDFLADEPRIDAVKMDIEGSEMLAWRGMRGLLNRHRPLLFTELHPAALRQVSGVEPEVFLEELRSAGYDLYVLDRAHGRHPRPQTNEEILSNLRESLYDHIELLGIAAHKS